MILRVRLHANRGNSQVYHKDEPKSVDYPSKNRKAHGDTGPSRKLSGELIVAEVMANRMRSCAVVQSKNRDRSHEDAALSPWSTCYRPFQKLSRGQRGVISHLRHHDMDVLITIL